MFGHRFFGAAYYGPRYFGDGGSGVPVVPPPPDEEEAPPRQVVGTVGEPRYRGGTLRRLEQRRRELEELARAAEPPAIEEITRPPEVKAPPAPIEPISLLKTDDLPSLRAPPPRIEIPPAYGPGGRVPVFPAPEAEPEEPEPPVTPWPEPTAEEELTQDLELLQEQADALLERVAAMERDMEATLATLRDLSTVLLHFAR